MAEVKRDVKEMEAKPSPALSEEDRQSVSELSAGSPKVVHEVVRLQGDEELDRPLQSLLFSGFAAGVAVSASIMTQAFLRTHLPDAPWAELIVLLGYTTGFVIVILGNLQLFTESTVTAVLPVATHPTMRNFGRLLRLWVAVLAANLAGTFLVALAMSQHLFVDADELAAAIAVSAPALSHDFASTILLAIPAGFLIASIAWILPNARGSEFWVIIVITYIVALGGFVHIVAGSGEAWLLLLTGKTSLTGAVGGFLVPAFIGNVIGGSCLFSVLAHGQVRHEIKAGDR